jgi:hypothetical protein
VYRLKEKKMMRMPVPMMMLMAVFAMMTASSHASADDGKASSALQQVPNRKILVYHQAPSYRPDHI